MSDFEVLRETVRREFPTLAYFVNWLQSDGMEATLLAHLKKQRGYSDDFALAFLDDALMNGVDVALPPNKPLGKLFKAKEGLDDTELLADLTMAIERLAELASELPPYQFPREAIPSDACIKALYGLLKFYKQRQIPTFPNNNVNPHRDPMARAKQAVLAKVS